MILKQVNHAFISQNIPSDTFAQQISKSACACAICSKPSLGTFWIAKDAKFLHADKEDWLDCVDVQADLSLRHYENRPFKYRENFTSKNWKFSDKILLIVFIFLLKT